MAERRMIHKKASVSTDLAELHAKHGGDALAFYLLMIPHFDRWGCVPDDAVKLRAMVVPMLEVSIADVKAWIAWMVKRGMLKRLTGPKGDKGLQSPDFHEHQLGSDFNRESPSDYEPPYITETWTRDGKKPNRADLQASRRQVADQSPTSRKQVSAKGRERKGRESSLSLPPSPLPSDSAAGSVELSPAAQPHPPKVEVNGDTEIPGEYRLPRLVASNGGEPVRAARDLLLDAVKNPGTRAHLQRKDTP